MSLRESPPLAWSRAVRLAFCWALGGVVGSALLAGLIVRDRPLPDLDTFAAVTAVVWLLLPGWTQAVHRSWRVTALVFPAVLIAAMLIVGAVMMLSLLRN